LLAGLSWVLRSVYGLERETIADTLRMISSCGDFLYKSPRPIKAAIECYVDGYDLADALILSINIDDGATTTYTFDKKAGKLHGYGLLQ
jgi:predicted nucleic-acid-binding protein